MRTKEEIKHSSSFSMSCHVRVRTYGRKYRDGENSNPAIVSPIENRDFRSLGREERDPWQDNQYCFVE